MHISVCVCTFRRAGLLRRLLSAIEHQVTDGKFSFSVVVADNDYAFSGRQVVEDFGAHSPIKVVYCVEPQRNIALARNRAAAHAHGDFVAWIDDDEFPARDWLLLMVVAAARFGAAGVLGPVRPHFDSVPPRWLVEGRFCERAEYPTGTVMHWSQSFAGNALIRLDHLLQHGPPFRAEFGLGGEDVDFFRRMFFLGLRFVWCNEAVVYEVVPPNRWTRRYRLIRAMLLGRSSLKLGGVRSLMTSLVAVPVYSLILPLTIVLGEAGFMRYGVKLSSHLGRVLAWVKINPIRERPE